MAGNQLEARQSYPSYNVATHCIATTDIPVRDATEGNFIPIPLTGQDKVHTFPIDPCPPGRSSNYCFTALFDITLSVGTPTDILCLNTEVTFVNQSTNDPALTYAWNFGEGASILPFTENVFNNHTVTWTTEGIKTITLIVTNTATGHTETYTKNITLSSAADCVGTNCLSFLINPICDESNGKLLLEITITPTTGPYNITVYGKIIESQESFLLNEASFAPTLSTTFIIPMPLTPYYTIVITDSASPTPCSRSISGYQACTCIADFHVTSVYCDGVNGDQLHVLFDKSVRDATTSLVNGDFSSGNQSYLVVNGKSLFTVVGDNGCSLTGIAQCPNLFNVEDGNSIPVGINNPDIVPYSFNTPTADTPSQTVCVGQQICLPYSVMPINGTITNVYTNRPGTVLPTDVTNQTGTFCWTPTADNIGANIVRFYATRAGGTNEHPLIPTLTFADYHITITCCPTTFTATNPTPAYIGCNGALLIGGTANIISDATCLQNYNVANSINHTAYGLQSGNNTIHITANGNTYTSTVNIPTIAVDNNALQVTANTTKSAHSCSTDYCTGTITLSAYLNINETTTNTNNTYTWSDCALCNTPTRTNLCVGNYTVTITNTTSGCSKTFTYTVSATDQLTYATPYEQVMCCVENTNNLTVKPTDTGITYPDALQPTRPAYTITTNQSWTNTTNPFNTTSALYFATDLVIASGTQLDLQNISLHFAPHTRILVQGGGILTVGNQTTIDGFCDAMWQGIQVEGATTANNNTPAAAYFNNCTIQNAMVGIAGMNIPLMNCNNIATINITSANAYYSASSLALPYLWHPNSRNTAGGLIQSTNTTFNNCLQGINISWYANDQNLFENCTFNSTQIQFPFNNLTQQTEVGIDGLYIKTLGSLTNNNFNNLRYGIRLNEVNLCKITQNYFNNNKCGVSSRAWLLGIDNGTYLSNNYFENNQIAVQADGLDNLLVRENQINQTSNSQTSYTNGSAGIYARGCNSLLQNNQINKVRFGIILSDSDDDGSQIAGNIINQTKEAIVCEGNNGSCYFTCNHLLDFTKFGLDIRSAGTTTGKLPPQGDCSTNEPASNTFIPLDATDIVMGSNTNDLYYNDVAADMLLVAYADGTLTGQFIPQTDGCNGVNLVSYCDGLRLTSLADIDIIPEGIKRNKEITKQFLTFLANEDYESAVAVVHKYNNNIMLRKLVPHKINKDSILVAESLLQGLSTKKEEYLRYKQLYTLLIDIAKDNHTIFDLNTSEQELLISIANSSTKTAYKAQTLLYAINGQEYPVVLPTLANGLPQNDWIIVFKADQAGRISALYPNPTNNIASINYQLVDKQIATISLFDVIGHLLSTTTLSNSGTYSFDTNSYPSGIYLCQIKVDGKLIKTEKLVVTR